VDTPRLGLVFNRDKLTAKMLYMEAFRAPKPWDFTDGVGNPDLEPEAMRSYEVSGAWSFSQHVRLDLAAYHNRLAGLLTRSEEEGAIAGSTPGRRAPTASRSSSVPRGALKGFVNYSYTDSRDEQGAVSRRSPGTGPRRGSPTPSRERSSPTFAVDTWVTG
jgi:outer membrane cobalamin receptor